MREDYQLLHSQMLHDIERCMQLELPERENAESCFWIANNYWEKLKELIKGKEFKDESDEVEFFRNVKPQFTCHIEYFVILSEALMFVPEERSSAIKYWEEESKRFKRLCDRNDDFIRYYESGDRYHDSLYFLRKGGDDQKLVALTPIYDADIAFCTSHDQVVRSYLAHKKYHEYAKGRKERLVKGN